MLYIILYINHIEARFPLSKYLEKFIIQQSQCLENFLFLSIKIYLRAMKYEQKILKTSDKKRFDLSKRTVYCLFKSKKSFTNFQSQIMQKNNKNQGSKLFNAQISCINSKKDVGMKTEQTNDAEIYRIGQFSKQFRCLKCGRIQSSSQQVDNICSQCHYLQKLVQKGNLQKFVLFLFDFKTSKPQSSQKHRHKIQRIQSIESCQSLIVDKGDDSRNHIQHRKLNQNYNQIKESSNKSINSLDIDRYVQKGNDLISSANTNKLGYFCNQCQVVPIVGRRFHCLTCQDFDLCERCYFYIGHKHQVKTFDDKKLMMSKDIHLQLLKKSQKLKNTLNYLSSSSIREFQTKTKLYKTSTLRQINPKK